MDSNQGTCLCRDLLESLLNVTGGAPISTDSIHFLSSIRSRKISIPVAPSNCCLTSPMLTQINPLFQSCRRLSIRFIIHRVQRGDVAGSKGESQPVSFKNYFGYSESPRAEDLLRNSPSVKISVRPVCLPNSELVYGRYRGDSFASGRTPTTNYLG